MANYSILRAPKFKTPLEVFYTSSFEMVRVYSLMFCTWFRWLFNLVLVVSLAELKTKKNT